MFFSVIYSVDCELREPIANYAPPRVNRRVGGERVWRQTEGNEQVEEPFTKHRKWCAILSAKDFREFVDHCGLTADSCETMGSLGAPGFDMGWAPAIAFNGDETAYTNAYVTPVCDKLFASRERKGRTPGGADKDWERIKAAVVRAFGN